jgi:hypothetical protein
MGLRLRRLRSGKANGKPGEWYYCLRHRRVEEGPDCPARNRLGPYPTRAEAEQAIDIVAERNDEWDNDPRWNDSGSGEAKGSGGPQDG